MSLSYSVCAPPSYNPHIAARPVSSRMDFFRKLGKKRTGSVSSKDGKSPSPITTSTPVFLTTTTPTRRPQATMDLAPPSYNESISRTNTKPTTNTNSNPRAAVANHVDSQYAFLAQFDTIFLVDDSGSMHGRSWRETSAALKAITPVCTQFDDDGIDIFFLNHRNPRVNSGLAAGGYTNVNSPDAVTQIFENTRPLGGTPTGQRLNQILRPYLASLEASIRNRTETPKPLNIIVITDGVPTDDVESVIVYAARKLDNLDAEPWQIGIQFFQVGEDTQAANELKNLDDALSTIHNVRDMVDTVPWSGESGRGLDADGILKVVLGSVNRRLDRRTA